MDPLSDFLSTLQTDSYMFRGLDVAGNWSLRFPANEGISCYAVLAGHCWLAVDGLEDAVRLAPGDCVLLTRRQSFVLASDLALPPSDAVAFVTAAAEGGVATLAGGGQVKGIGGYFTFAGKGGLNLLRALPAIVHVRRESERAALFRSMELLMQELREPQAGNAIIARYLAQIMLVLALRHFLSNRPTIGAGWLIALSDRQLGPAVEAIHADPAHRWTVQTLAQHACMSRASFAFKFKQTVGVSPVDYVVRWRMQIAVEKLMSRCPASISVIARSLGYDSDGAFSTAFKRTMGCSPNQYRQRAKGGA